MAVFGCSGADMIPLLNSGAKGIADLEEEARQLGITLSKETTQAAEGFNDNLTRLGKVIKSIWVQVSPQLTALPHSPQRPLADGLRLFDRESLMTTARAIIGRMICIQAWRIEGLKSQGI